MEAVEDAFAKEKAGSLCHTFSLAKPSANTSITASVPPDAGSLNVSSRQAMQIVPQGPARHIKEHDEILLRLLAERAPEWQSLTGIRRIVARIKIELWAWRQTQRELRSRCNQDDRHKVY